MSILQFLGVGYDLPAETLFDDVTFTLSSGSRVALVGENGAGKTTLMRLAAGQLQQSRGSVTLNGRAALLPQHLPDEPEIPGSGGEVQRRRLEGLFAASADLYLLDEPTHHLDIEAMEWLQWQLSAIDAAVLFVSHDREFLDAVATDVAFLERSSLSLEAGNYSKATARRMADEAAQMRRHGAQSRRRSNLEREFHRQRSQAKSAEKFNHRRAEGQPLILAKGKAEAVGRTMARRARSLASRLEREEVEAKPWQDNRRLEFVAQPTSPGPNEGITAEGLVVRRGGKTIVDGVDLYVRRSERIALVGPNGSGKSTLLSVLSGANEPDAGAVRLGVGLSVSASDQAAEPWSNAATVGDVLYQVNKGLLDADVWRVTAAVGVPSGPERALVDLSGGERRRLTLARIAVADSHLLILDEPTHHLDLRAVEALEGLLETITGTVLLATHDRRLVDRVASRVWRLDGEGGFSDEPLTGSYAGL